MSQGMSIAVLYLVLQCGLVVFVYPQSIIQSQDSGHWVVVLLGWLLQGVMLRLIVGGLREEKGDLLTRFNKAGIWIRLLLLWPLLFGNLLALAVIVGGHSKVFGMLYLPDTPQWILSALLLVASISISYAERDSLLRLASLIALFGAPLIMMSFGSMAKYMNYHLVFPIQPSFGFMREVSSLPLLFNFTNVVGLVGFMGPMSANAKRWLWGAWVLSLLFFFSIAYLPLSVFGQEVADNLRFPLITALDTATVNWFFFDRISMFYIMAMLLSTLINVSALLWLTRKLCSGSSTVRKLIGSPITMAVLSLFFVSLIPNVESVEHMMRWIGPVRCGVLCMVAVFGAYCRSLLKQERQPHA
ncbi:GerAB/ArcD/ProY family transporter [Paenibacillus kobensis]|uniref:GerAB/ArcD/ProY family transporter n=1 Tax=Paenibacillus kobensis TaxID=59841 RepID=UPI000FD75EF8|nr:GerAB/ArcD/ProY family transporter [Paenibacillus kobensis]